jgi:hypothetical protein
LPINPLSQDEADNKEKKYSTISGESTNVSGLSQGQPATAKGGPTSSGSFTNLQSYLDANKDQSAGLGAKVEQGIQSTVNQGRTELDNSNKEFNQKISDAGIDRNAMSAQALRSIANKAYTSPNALNDSDVGMYDTIRAKTSSFDATAPKQLNDLSSYQTAKSTLQQAQDKAALTGSEGGRETLLRDQFKRPDYSKGQSSLDQLFTQNVPENRQRFEKLRSGLLGDSGLVSEQNKAIQAANEKRTATQGDLSLANQDIQDILFNPKGLKQNLAPTILTAPGGTPPAMQNGFLSSAEQAALQTPVQKQAAYQESVKKAQEALNQYKQNNNLFNADISSAFVDPNNGQQATLENSLSSDQLAQLQALNRLAGRNVNTIGDKVIGGLVDPNNRFNTQAQFDSGKANNLIAERANQFGADLSNTLQNNINKSVEGYKFGDLPVGKAADDIEAKLTDAYMRPDVDVDEAEKVLNTYAGVQNEINKTRQIYGLPPINSDSFYEGGSRSAAIQNAAKSAVAGYLKEYSPDTADDPDKVNFYTNQLLQNHQLSGVGQDTIPGLLKNIEQIAQLRAFRNLINANQRQVQNPMAKI